MNKCNLEIILDFTIVIAVIIVIATVLKFTIPNI